MEVIILSLIKSKKKTDFSLNFKLLYFPVVNLIMQPCFLYIDSFNLHIYLFIETKKAHLCLISMSIKNQNSILT